MGDWSRWEEDEAPRRTYSPAEAAADLEFYRSLKRGSSLGTLTLVALVAVPLSPWYPWQALALAAGGASGVANALLSMRGNERLLERRNVGAFVLSSLLRLGAFGIVPVMLVLKNPSIWTLGAYFAGFFTPLALGSYLTYRRNLG